MSDRVYEAYPELYDCFHTDYQFGQEIEFVLDRAADAGVTQPARTLEIGCGTGEHTRRLAAQNLDVVGIDPHRGVLRHAAKKTASPVIQGGLPGLPIDRQFEIVVAIRAVINHLAPDLVEQGLRELTEHVTDPGVLIFDNFRFPRDGADVVFEVGNLKTGNVGRIVTMNPTPGEWVNWDSMFFLPDGEQIINRRSMSLIEDDRIAEILASKGFEVEQFEGYYDGDHRRTVFVASRST